MSGDARAALAATVSAVSLLVLGWWIRDQIVTSGGDWTPVLGFAFGGAAGALIGAFGAWIVAHGNRQEAKRTRFHNDLRSVATEMHRSAEMHLKQRRQQFASWMEVAELYSRIPNYQMEGDEIPRVDDTEPVYYAALALELTAGASTIEAAWNLYRAARDLDLDGLSFIKTDDDKLGPPSSQALLLYEPRLGVYRARAKSFVNAVRAELDEDLLESLPDPEAS